MRIKILILSLSLYCCTVVNFSFAQVTALSSNSNTLIARAPDSRGWTDPALNHNRLLREQLGEGTYIVIGNYKVKGSPYLFGGRHNSDLFSQKEKAYNIDIRYNTYNQEVEFYSTANANPLVKLAGEVDSFTIKQDIANGITSDMRFIYGSLIGSSEKAYFLEVETGTRYTLYKRYKADIDYVSENYVQSELRQFELESDYFYYDAETKTLKKLKMNLNSINKEFKSIHDVSAIVTNDAFVANPEEMLKKVIQSLNTVKKAF